MRALRRAFEGIGEHQLLAVATVLAVAVVLTLAGAFGLVASNLSSVLDRWGKDVQISCYLRSDLSDDTVFALKAELEAMPEIVGVEYVSPDEALALFADAIDGMDRLLADLDGNPLPASLEVRLAPAFQRPSEVEAVAARLRRPEFEDLDWSQEWVERFHTFVSLLRLSTVVLGLLLLGAGLFIVHNTVRLAVHARRDELEIISLVGGTRVFAWAPFIAEGGILGFVGGVLSVASLWAVHRWAFVALESSLGLLLGPEVLRFLPLPSIALLVASGVLVGLLGALASVVRTAPGEVR
jgi:cell division transport system permease protein